MPGRSYRFTHAIAREPAASAVDGLRAVDTGAPDLARFRAHHADSHSDRDLRNQIADLHLC